MTFVGTGDGEWRAEDGGRLVGTARPRTDLFVDPVTGAPTLNAPRLLTPAPRGEFRLSARVELKFESTYDAGCLLVWAGEATWGKLCFEYSPRGQGMAVSVVTRGVSDDANGFTVDGSTLWLRLSRKAGAYAFHASTDGLRWEFVRHFSLGDGPAEIGFEAQSPLGDGLTATFTELAFAPTAPADLRDGQ